MSRELFQKRTNKYTVILISAAVVLLVLLSAWAFVGFIKGSGDSSDTRTDTYTGTDGEYKQMLDCLDEFYSGKSVTLSAGGKSVLIEAVYAGVTDEAGLRLFFGKKGYEPSMIDAFLDYLGSGSPPDEEYISAKIEELAGSADTGYNSYFDVDEDSLRIVRGVSKTVINAEKTLALIINALRSGSYGDIGACVEEIIPEDPNWELIRSSVNTEPENAQYILSEDGLCVLKPEIVGALVDIDVIKADYYNGSWDEKVFPITVKLPDITVENIKGKLFADVLSSYTTYYNKNLLARTNNLALASQAINGTVVLPGERFSFNKVVGQRTAEKGYQAAPIYAGANQVNEIGGGICQVASTLYCATLCENLKQVTRWCHSQTVSYVPLGMDATIYWGSADYVFENNTENPIMISLTCVDGSLTAKILGKQTVNILADFRPETIETYTSPFSDTLVGSMAPGDEKIISKGKDGYLIYLYRTLTIDGVVQEEMQINTSRYIPTTTKRNVGPPVMTTVPETTADTTAPETTAEPPPG